MAFDIDAERLWSNLDHARSRGELDQIKQMLGHQLGQILDTLG